MKESDGDLAGASDCLQEVQIETVGSMESLEKTSFILEQMRLCLDTQDWVRAEITAQKISRKLLTKEEYQDSKIQYYELMVRFHAHKQNYFEVCKAYRSIFDTPKIQASTDLAKHVYFCLHLRSI